MIKNNNKMANNLWKQTWDRIWPDSKWLDHVYEEGFTPVLAGIDLLSEKEKKTLVLGLVPKDGSLSLSALGEKAFDNFLSQLHEKHDVDGDKTGITLHDTKTRLITGLYNFDYWKENFTDTGNVIDTLDGKLTTAVMFYKDPKMEIHKKVEDESIHTLTDGGFIVALPAELGAWTIL